MAHSGHSRHSALDEILVIFSALKPLRPDSDFAYLCPSSADGPPYPGWGIKEVKDENHDLWPNASFGPRRDHWGDH